jgi:hypothetical protein
MPIISDDDMRPVMMGNFFDMESKKIVSTDAHKLTAINMPKDTFNLIAVKYNKELNENPKGLIFHTLKQLQTDYNELVKIGGSEQVGLQPFDEFVEKRIIEDGNYPNYDAVIPKEFTNEIYVDFTKLYWYSKVLLDAKLIDDKTKINSSNDNEYQNKKIEYLKDSYVPFLSVAKQIIFTYTLDGKKEYIGFDARYICDVLKFAMEYKGKTFGKVGLSGNNRAMVIEFENGLYSPSDSIGLIMPVMIMNNDEYTIGQVDYDFNVKMYYDLDTNEIISDGVNYPIDESIGFIPLRDFLPKPKIKPNLDMPNDSISLIDSRIKGLRIALKVAKAENKPKIEKRILGLEIAQKVQAKQETTEVANDNSFIDDIDIENKILIVAEKGKPLSKYKNGDKVFYADYSFDKKWKQYVEGEVFIKDNEYSIKRFPQNITFKKYPLATFNSNTKVALKPNNEPIYSSDKTIKNEIEKTKNTIKYEDLLQQDMDIQSEIDIEKRKPKNEQSELKRLALEREVISRKIKDMEQFTKGGGVDGINWYKYDGQYEAEFGNFYLYVIPSNERGRYYVRVTDGYRGDLISESREEILGLDNAKEFATDIVGDYMKQFNNGGVVFTNYNGSEIMYEPNYDEYFVNDEVFYSMEDAKNYIDTGEMENEKYSFGGGLLVGSLVGGYLGYKIGKYNKQTLSSGFQTEKLIGKDIKNKLQGKKFDEGGVVDEIKTKYQIAGSDSSGVYTYSKRVADEIASKYGGDVQEDGSKWYVRLEENYDKGGEVDTISDEDLLRIKLAVAEAQDRIKANDKESESGGSASDITNFIKENPQLLMLLEKGGSVGDENYEMLKNKVTELLHHSKELQAVVKKKPKTPAWVISKSSRASTDLSDITHYLEGKL